MRSFQYYEFVIESTKCFIGSVTNFTGDEQDIDHQTSQWEIPEIFQVQVFDNRTAYHIEQLWDLTIHCHSNLVSCDRGQTCDQKCSTCCLLIS